MPAPTQLHSEECRVDVVQATGRFEVIPEVPVKFRTLPISVVSKGVKITNDRTVPLSPSESNIEPSRSVVGATEKADVTVGITPNKRNDDSSLLAALEGIDSVDSDRGRVVDVIVELVTE